jgi:hypothetical protein
MLQTYGLETLILPGKVQNAVSFRYSIVAKLYCVTLDIMLLFLLSFSSVLCARDSLEARERCCIDKASKKFAEREQS